MQVSKSNKLANVCYDIRGPVLKHAKRLEEEGQRILKLNIGNPAPFGFEAPEEILQDVIRNLPTAQRVPLVLYHLEGLRYEEIAEKVGVSLGKVKTDIFRGRETLRRKLRLKLAEEAG